ncbi:hypothetical protein H4Q26_009365 [Puccinia striiformis f. sp. tritici PST-130]|nr:hypothetical protein H4Q26_009365 [Puccinia striiformis f. sp. tritici PST-130]
MITSIVIAPDQISLLNQGEPINANSDSIKNAAEQFPTILQSVNLRFKSKSDAIYESDPSDHMEASSSQYENRKRAKFYKGETPETLWKILEKWSVLQENPKPGTKAAWRVKCEAFRIFEGLLVLTFTPATIQMVAVIDRTKVEHTADGGILSLDSTEMVTHD